jgi:hypothetical protein
MSVLPDAASLGSFFVVVVLLLLFTLIGMNLPALLLQTKTTLLQMKATLSALRRRTRNLTKGAEGSSKSLNSLDRHLIEPIVGYFGFYYELIDPYQTLGPWELLCKYWCPSIGKSSDTATIWERIWNYVKRVALWSYVALLRYVPGLLVRLMGHELTMPRKQLNQWRNRNHFIFKYEVKPWLVLPNGFRIMLMPLWAALGSASLIILMVEDFVVLLLFMPFNILMRFY